MAKAIWQGTILAESDDIVVVEGNAYFPRNSVRREYLSDSEKTTFCGWKGEANYYTLRVDGVENSDAAWYYSEPKPKAAEIRNYVAFWRGVEVEV